MSRINDKAYIFSVSNGFFGKIIAYCGDSESRVIGKDIFAYLGMCGEDEEELREVISAYGKDGYATASYNGRWHAVFFFKDFACNTGLCLAVVPAVSARSAAEAMSDGVFGGFRVSERLLGLAKRKDGGAIFCDSGVCMHLSRIFGQIIETTALEMEYGAQPTEDIRSTAEGAASLAGISLDFDTYPDFENAALVSSDEIFDGRFCSAVIITFAMMASKFSSDSALKVVAVRGMGAVELRISFKKRLGGWQEPLEYLKNMAYSNHGIRFDVDGDGKAVGIRFIPFYQDVGFVGVKQGDEIFDIVSQMELR